VNPGHGGERARNPCRIAIPSQDLDGLERAGADARALERDQAVACLAVLGERVQGRGPGLQRGGGDDERRQHDPGGARTEPAVADHQLSPRRPPPAGLIVGPDMRPVEPVAELCEHDGKKRAGHDHADKGDQHAGVADRAQEGNGEDDHREQAYGNRGTAEGDRAPGGPRGPRGAAAPLNEQEREQLHELLRRLEAATRS
jgi:hypothetical protein